MSNWKYADNTNRVVSRINADGSSESCLALSLAAGISPEPADIPPVTIPQQITMKQARTCLITKGLFAQIDNAISSLTGMDGDLARAQWDYSATLDRNSPLVAQITTQLGFTLTQVDELFTFAATL